MEYGKNGRKTAGEGMHQIIIDGNAFYEIDEDCVRRKQEKAAAAQQRIENREQEKKEYGTTDRSCEKRKKAVLVK